MSFLVLFSQLDLNCKGFVAGGDSDAASKGVFGVAQGDSSQYLLILVCFMGQLYFLIVM